jgi:hypothetical protein
MPVFVLPGVEADGLLETWAKAVFQGLEPAQVFAADKGACPDLDLAASGRIGRETGDQSRSCPDAAGWATLKAGS